MSTIDKRDILLRQSRNLFHTKDLSLLWDINNPATLRRTISRYVKEGLLSPSTVVLFCHAP